MRSRAVLLDNPDEAPGAWDINPLEQPRKDFGVVIGSGTVEREGKHVYAFGPLGDTRRAPAVLNERRCLRGPPGLVAPGIICHNETNVI